MCLNMTINQAVEFFENIPAIIHKLKTLKEVGLGLYNAGTPSTTISGGEAQRVKLARNYQKEIQEKPYTFSMNPPQASF